MDLFKDSEKLCRQIRKKENGVFGITTKERRQGRQTKGKTSIKKRAPLKRAIKTFTITFTGRQGKVNRKITQRPYIPPCLIFIINGEFEPP